MCFSAIAGIATAVAGAFGVNKAAKAGKKASRKQLALQTRIYDEQTANFQPFLEAGEQGIEAYKFELGLGERPEGYEGFQASESFDNILEAGRDTIESGAASGGKLFSGASGTALEKIRMGLASNEVNNYLNRLGSLGQQGQAAAGNQAAAGTNYAQMGSTSLANFGNAQAAGAIGVGNAITSGLNAGIGAYGFSQGQNDWQLGTPWSQG